MAPAQRLGPASEASRTKAPGPSVRVGCVSGSHGLHGALRVRLDNPDSIQWAAAGRVYLQADTDTLREYVLRECRRINRASARLKLDGIDDAGSAACLRGATVLVAAADLPPLPSGEFYYFQIVGVEVRTIDGRFLGQVAEVFSSGANDVCAVRDGSRELLIPMIGDVVRELDPQRRIMTVEIVPGLIG